MEKKLNLWTLGLIATGAISRESVRYAALEQQFKRVVIQDFLANSRERTQSNTK